jgi:hypothetical protein
MPWKVQSKLIRRNVVGYHYKWHDGLTFPTYTEAEKNMRLGERKAGKTYDFRVVKA